eukprot:359786-Chlamydomonas_euryale.AAC.9
MPIHPHIRPPAHAYAHLVCDLKVPPQRRVQLPQHRRQPPHGRADTCGGVVGRCAEVVAAVGDELDEAPKRVGLGVLLRLRRAALMSATARLNARAKTCAC